MCSWGPALEFSLLYLLSVGPSDRMIDFDERYTLSWFAMATFGALCCNCGDTCSSQIGTVIGVTTESTLITNLRKVPRGTNGGVSKYGTIASIIGGVSVGGAYYVGELITCIRSETAPSQFLLIPIGGILGLLGSTIDSLLGATLQYSGYDKEHRKIVEDPGPNVDYICGKHIMDNNSVNMLASLLTGVLAPYIVSTIFSVVS